MALFLWLVPPMMLSAPRSRSVRSVFATLLFAALPIAAYSSSARADDARAKELWQLCSSCHGQDGKGNQLIGAPDGLVCDEGARVAFSAGDRMQECDDAFQLRKSCRVEICDAVNHFGRIRESGAFEDDEVGCIVPDQLRDAP